MLERDRERKREKDKEMGRGDVKAIKDLMILDLVMHTRLPEQGKLRKSYIEGQYLYVCVSNVLPLYFYRADEPKKKRRK